PSGSIASHLAEITSPTYVRGVGTSMTKLLQLVRPDVVYFGQREALEVALIRQLIRDLSIDVSLRVLPCMRENDGLMMDKSNFQLSPLERQAARVLYRALLAGKALIEQGEFQPSVIAKTIADVLATEPLVVPDHIDICYPDTFV